MFECEPFFVAPFTGGITAPADWWLAGASIDLSFQTAQYYDSGAGGAGQAVTDYLSCSRASVGYATTSSGTLTSFGTNTLRITDLGLLVEDARTNAIGNSETGGSAFNAALTANATNSPAGTLTADNIAPSNTNGVTQSDAFGHTTSVDGAGSIFLKQGTGTSPWINVRVENGASGTDYFGTWFNTATGATGATNSIGGTGTVTSKSTEILANGWIRAIVVGQFSVSQASNLRLIIRGPFASDGGTSADTSADYFVWGMQFEDNAPWPSSYIPTTGSPATRAQDAVTCIGNLNTLYTGVTKSMVMKTLFNPAVTAVNFDALLGQTSPQNWFFYHQGAILNVVRSVDNVTSLAATSGSGDMLTPGAKYGTAIDGSGRSLVFNAGTVASDGNPVTPTGTVSINTNSPTFFYCQRLTSWNTRLANAPLQGFTAP